MISKIFLTKKTKNLHPLFYFSSQELIKCEYFQSKVALLTLNRPKQLNALNENLIKQLIQTLTSLDSDPNIHAIVITGNEKAFAAGGDLKEMKDKTYPQTYT